MKLNWNQWTAVIWSSGFSVLIFWLFKLIGKRPLFLPAVIVWNYIVCVLLGGLFLMAEPDFYQVTTLNREGLIPIISLGVLFMITFLLMGKATAISGAALSAVASKMSVVVPVLVAISLWHEPLALWGYMGMGLTLISVFLISYQPGSASGKPIHAALFWVFIGSGLVDTGMAFIKKANYTDWTNLQFAVLTFLGAAITGFTYLLIKSEWNKLGSKYEFFWGAILGTVNLVSIFAMYRGLDYFENQSSIFFMLNNISVVVGSFMLGVMIKETYTQRSLLGLMLAVLAIFLLG